MDRPPPRGRNNQRYDDGRMNYDYQRQGSPRFFEHRDGFDSQPPPDHGAYYDYDRQQPDRRMLYYDRDQHWQSRQCDPDYRDSMGGSSHYDYHEGPYEHERAPPPNPRGSWARGRRNKRGNKGKGVTKAEPPMILGGIPHLERSFVMGKKEEGDQDGSGGTNQPGEQNTRSDNGSMEQQNIRCREGFETISDTRKESPAEQPLFSGQSREGMGNNDFGKSGNAKQAQEQSAQQSDSHLRNDLQLETVDSEEEYDNISPSDNGQMVCAAQQKNDTAISNAKETKTELPKPEEVLQPDPAKLEMETERYYDELLGKKEGEKKDEAEILSASQVAKITVAYKTVEEQQKEEENQKIEEEKKAKERQAQIETAWSILHQYWQFVSENPYDFNGWTYLLNHVESMNNLEAARSAFEGFLPLYPYCFAYWKKISDMEFKHKNVERSLGILLIGIECVPFCIDLWVPLLENYIAYAKEKSLEPQHVRVLYKYGLDSAGSGWHSSALWEACINYEQQTAGDLVQVMRLYERLLATPTKLYNKHWDHFLAIIRDHHPRNLLSVEEYHKLRKETCEELNIKYTPSSMVPPKSVHKTPQPEDKLSSCMKEKLVASYIKTHEHNEEEVDKRWKFEERIKRPYFHVKPLDKKQLKNWNEYLDFEIGIGDPVRIIPLFERALVACALYEEMWCRYALYMEKHVQDVVDGVYSEQNKKKESEESEKKGSEAKEVSGDQKKEEKQGKVEEKVERRQELAEGSECTDKKISSDKSDENCQVNGDERVVDVKDVKNDSGVRGSVANEQSDTVRDSSLEKDSSQCNCDKDSDSKCEIHTKPQQASDSSESDQTLAPQGKDSSDKTEPPTYGQLKDELVVNIAMAERVLKCPPLTPEWIKRGVSWEDVRHTYRRGAWIHCPSKPRLLMQWAEFEEMQGNLDTARELLSTVTAKHPTFLKARMQLIELERRAQNYQRVEELYAEASRAVTEPRHRSWLAIRYARFLFKILLEADRALAVLRKALKKDRGNIHLYHHVFDICYQRQPLDCQGVLASVMLALASKELSVQSKYWFAYKRVEFLREHGEIRELKKAQRELKDLETLVEEENAKKVKEEEEKKENETEASDNTAKDATQATESTDVKNPEATAAAGGEVAGEALNPHTVHMPEAQPNQQFPVPYFAADGAITYTPMEGYGYGYSDPNQALPTAQEVVQGAQGSLEQLNPSQDSHKVPPTWELNVQLGGYGYGKSDEHRWHQNAGYCQYDDLVSNGYPDHLKDNKTEEFKLPFQPSIDHLRRQPGLLPPGRMPDLSQPPPSAPGTLPPTSMAPPTDASHTNLPPPILPGVLPPKFTRPPPLPGLGGSGMFPSGYRPLGGPLDNLPPGERPPHPSDRSYMDGPQSFGKRRHPEDYSSGDEPPYKMSHMEMDRYQYRPEYDNIYTNSPGPCAPPSHRAHFLSWNRDYDSYMPYSHREEERHDMASFRESPELSRFNEAKRYSLRDEDNYSPIPRELGMQDSDNLCVNVPEWLVQDGGELCLSETDRGVALIRYWPNFMTESGQMSIFRILRKGLKWHQRRALVEGKWQNLPHLLSWIGPCDYSYSGVTLEKNTNWLPEIVDLLHRLIRYTGNQYNSCFLNLYRNGYDHVNWMSENHPALRDDPSIAFVSLGVTRLFEMQRKDGSGFLRFPLFPGSLLLMEGATQEDWQHQFPKQPNVAAERIHITFRKMYMIEGLTV